MLWFLWSSAPKKLKYLLLALALVSGFSRDYVMLVVSKAAAAPLAEATHFWLPLFALALFVVVMSSFAYQVLSTVVTTSVINKVRMQLINNLFDVQPTFLEKYQHGSLYHILTTDVGTVASFTTTLLGLLPSIVFLAIAIPQLFYYSFFAGFFALLVMVGGTFAYYVQQKSMSKLNTDARQLDVNYFEGITELLQGFRELKLNRAKQSSFSRNLSSVLDRYRAALIAVSRIYETGEAAVSALKFLLFGGIVFLVPNLYQTETSTTFVLLTLVLFCLTPFEQVISSYPAVISTLVSYERIADLHRQLMPFAGLYGPDREIDATFKCISLRNISVKYDSRESSSFILGPVDFEFKAGEVVLLVGANGSGKSTFMNVLAGLHDLKSGSISVDGKIQSASDMAGYRKRISAVFTQYHVFRNLFGLEFVSDAEAAKALEYVNLNTTTAIVNGKISRIDLSAGQKRRLALALALLEDRQILILDEFVADQDPDQREYFFKKLLPALKSKGKTVIVSTHDLQWAGCGDRLIRFDNGNLSEVHREQLS